MIKYLDLVRFYYFGGLRNLCHIFGFLFLILFLNSVWLVYIRRWDRDDETTTGGAGFKGMLRNSKRTLVVDEDDNMDYQRSCDSPPPDVKKDEYSDEDELDKYMAGIEVEILMFC